MRKPWLLAIGLGCVLLAPGGAEAGVTFDAGVLWQPSGDDDVQVYLHASNVVYPAPRQKVEGVFRTMRDPGRDYPVLAFIAHHARADIELVWALREEGHSWFEVMLRFGVKPDVLFVNLPKDPGPPYGKAWGHWRKQRNKVPTRHVNDEDVRFWVSVRTVAAYADITPAHAWQRHAAGEKVVHIAGSHFRAKGVGRDRQEQAGKQPPDKGRAKRGKGKDKSR